jgi:hypothetical protein
MKLRYLFSGTAAVFLVAFAFDQLDLLSREDGSEPFPMMFGGDRATYTLSVDGCVLKVEQKFPYRCQNPDQFLGTTAIIDLSDVRSVTEGGYQGRQTLSFEPLRKYLGSDDLTGYDYSSLLDRCVGSENLDTTRSTLTISFLEAVDPSVIDSIRKQV